MRLCLSSFEGRQYYVSSPEIQTSAKNGVSLGNLHLKVKVYINCPSKFKLPEFGNNPQNVSAHAPKISAYQQSCFSLRTATSLMPTDAIGRLQIGFTTVEAGDFPNGLRCNRQILYISAVILHITKFPHFPRTENRGWLSYYSQESMYYIWMRRLSVFISIRRRSFNPSARLAPNPSPCPSTVNT